MPRSSFRLHEIDSVKPSRSRCVLLLCEASDQDHILSRLVVAARASCEALHVTKLIDTEIIMPCQLLATEHAFSDGPTRGVCHVKEILVDTFASD